MFSDFEINKELTDEEKLNLCIDMRAIIYTKLNEISKVYSDMFNFKVTRTDIYSGNKCIYIEGFPITERTLYGEEIYDEDDEKYIKIPLNYLFLSTEEYTEIFTKQKEELDKKLNEEKMIKEKEEAEKRLKYIDITINVENKNVEILKNRIDNLIKEKEELQNKI